MMKPLIITITGKSRSGKTTLIEKLIFHYKSTGRKVSVIKSMRHDFHTDPEGKDTYRYRKSGAFSSIITNGKMFSFISDIDDGSDPLVLAKKYFSTSDIIIIEGFKEGKIPKIEVIGDSEEPPLFLTDKNIQMIVTDKAIDTVLPVFRRNDIKSIIEAIGKLF
jgi:molybdopterin-guanine dinucleotide biosynthesis protein B